MFSDNTKHLVEFYKKIFQVDPDWTGGDFTGFRVGDGEITFGTHDKVHGKNENPERIMFNLETEDVKGEFERIRELVAANVIKEPYQPEEEPDIWIATFSDPDGNYFQLSSPYLKK